MTLEKVQVFSEEVKSAVNLYSKALADTQGIKVCTEMGISQGVPHDRMYRALSLYHLTIPYIKAELYQKIQIEIQIVSVKVEFRMY